MVVALEKTHLLYWLHCLAHGHGIGDGHKQFGVPEYMALLSSFLISIEGKMR